MQSQELKVGLTVRIIAVQQGPQSYRQKIIAMGLLPGTTFKVVRMAPLGDPIEIIVRGVALSLRKNEVSLLHWEAI